MHNWREVDFAKAAVTRIIQICKISVLILCKVQAVVMLTYQMYIFNADSGKTEFR